MSDYTPNTDHVRMVYAGINENRRAEFDRWLAEHDRQVKAEALRNMAPACNCQDDWDLLRTHADGLLGGTE